jgi:N-acetylneuraminic acid mutarotase
MIVWGGYFNDGNDHYLNTGGRYNPDSDSWAATSTTNAPAGRDYHTAVWSGNEMIVWGGFDGNNRFNTGGRYNPGTNSWAATSTTSAPSARATHSAVWTGTEMIVWGGFGSDYLNNGGRYNPNTDSWIATSFLNAPTARTSHTAVWTGNEMILWGGYFFDGNDHFLNTGGRYNPSTDGWTATSITDAPSGRLLHTVVWTGNEMIVWGGENDGFDIVTSTGGRYCVQSGPTPTPTPTVTPTPTLTPSPTATPRATPRPRPTPHPRPTPP